MEARWDDGRFGPSLEEDKRKRSKEEVNKGRCLILLLSSCPHRHTCLPAQVRHHGVL